MPPMIGNLIALAVILLIVFFAGRAMWKKHKNGGGCGCGCSGCSCGCSSAKPAKSDAKK